MNLSSGRSRWRTEKAVYVAYALQFRLDGANLGAAVTAPPYTTTWNTTAAPSGPHTLSARAFDAAGNVASSGSVSVIVDNRPILGTLAPRNATAPAPASSPPPRCSGTGRSAPSR